MESAIKEPLSARINFRMIVFGAVLLGLIGIPVYIYVDSVIHHGIKNQGNYYEVDLKSMGNFSFNDLNGSVDDIPAQWRQLDGKRILLQGEVFAPNEAGDHMSQFQLVYSIAKCCFGGPPKVQERVFAVVPKDMEVPNLSYQFARVTGTLHINLTKEEGKVNQMYVLNVDKVEPM
jgi:hypothetical protein